MEKRTLLALALSLLVLGFYPVLLQKFYPEYGKPKPAVSAVKKAENISKPSETTPAVLSGAAFSDTEDVLYKNEKLRLIFNKKAGSIREIAFIDYLDLERKGPLKILSLSDSKGSPFSLQFSDAAGSVVYGPVKTVSAEKVSSFFSAYDGRLKGEKHFVFQKNGYASDVVLKFKNESDAPLEISYEFFAGSQILSRNAIDSQYIEANFFSIVDGKPKLRHLKESKLGKKVDSEGVVEWVAVKDRHFSIILKPKNEKNFFGVVRGMGEHHFSASLASPKITIPARGEITQEFLAYIGPTEVDKLLPIGLVDIVNFGKLDIIGKLLVGGLEMLHKIFRNYGIAIIMLTVLINVLLFPMTRMSYMSMKRMQLVQPQMSKLREQHKKNPERLNKEMMELYKKHKVNPFGGCLPMLLQMPVFIALYVALSKSVILIDASFLWVHDLSSPDRVYLPFALPGLGNYVHVLPIIMMVAMFLQQKFTQIKIEGQDPAMESQQKMMAYLMPVIFGFIFYTMPSALVLYWLTNTLLMSAYQLHLKKVTLT